MKVLIDVNVVLDVVPDRQPVEGALSADAVTTIYYLIRKDAGVAKAR